MEFSGYLRNNGLAGTRNYVGIIPTVACAFDAALWIAGKVTGSRALGLQQSCGLIGVDKEMVQRTLVNIGKNPNLTAVLIVGVGCAAGPDPVVIASAIAESGKPVEICRIHQEGGLMVAISRGVETAQRMASDATKVKRENIPVSKLRLGVKCGGSTPLSGPVSNAAMGAALDLIIENGGTGGFAETPEIIGAEHALAARAINDEVRIKLLKLAQDFEERIKLNGIDFFGSNPDQHNISEGLSSIEEKAVGALRKGGSTPLTAVASYGEIPQAKGMFFVDTPGFSAVALNGLVAAGCNIITYSTECATSFSTSVVPVIKLTANREHFGKYPDILDHLVDIDQAVTDIKVAGQEIFDIIIETASGKPTQSEITGYTGGCDLWTLLPSP